MNMTSYQCPTCDKEHQFTPYIIARLGKGLEHICNACTGITRLGPEGIAVVKPGAENPHYWAANGHYPCVITRAGETVPRVFAYKYDGDWFALREDSIANVEASIERVKFSIPARPAAPDHPEPQPTAWYPARFYAPVYEGWFHLLFKGGESANNWWWTGAKFVMQKDDESSATIPLHAVEAWRGQDREFS